MKTQESTRVSKGLRLSVWDMYVGTNKTTYNCFLCGRAELHKTLTKQWEACHIVAKTFHTKQPTRYDLLPGCPACNNECSNLCIFDYLWIRERYKQLKNIIKIIYKTYEEEHPESLEDDFEGEAWKLFQDLYGGKKFSAGGGIYNETSIYNFIKSVQIKDEYEKIKKYTRKIRESNSIIEKCTKRIKLDINRKMFHPK